jgi:hypothetical protein
VSITFTCSCGTVLRVPDSLAGRPVRCEGCGTVHRLPVTRPSEKRTIKNVLIAVAFVAVFASGFVVGFVVSSGSKPAAVSKKFTGPRTAEAIGKAVIGKRTDEVVEILGKPMETQATFDEKGATSVYRWFYKTDGGGKVQLNIMNGHVVGVD